VLILNPGTVRFGDQAWEDVAALAVDRAAARTVLEWSDEGPHAVLADVPEVRVSVRVVRRLDGGDLAAPLPGQQATLSFHTAPAMSDAGRRSVTMTAVVLSVTHELAGQQGARQVIALVAVAATGGADPVIVLPV